jgi:hypothetical protein
VLTPNLHRANIQSAPCKHPSRGYMAAPSAATLPATPLVAWTRLGILRARFHVYLRCFLIIAPSQLGFFNFPLLRRTIHSSRATQCFLNESDQDSSLTIGSLPSKTQITGLTSITWRERSDSAPVFLHPERELLWISHVLGWHLEDTLH